MQTYTYNWEVKDLLTQFLQAFDGAVIKRRSSTGVHRETVGVRYVYAPKQRILHDIVNKAQHITLPAVSFWITNISRDNSRVFNKLDGFFYNKSTYSSESTHTLQPLPINIEVSISIMTRYLSDMDQIVSNFVPYCDPYFVLSWNRIDQPGLEIRSEVFWNNDLKFDYSIEQTSSKPTRLICDTNFTIKGWMFKSDSIPDPADRIYRIDNNFYSTAQVPTAANAATIKAKLSSETVTVSAVPRIITANRWLTPVDYAGRIILKGSELDTVTAVYLSGNSPDMFTEKQTVDFFANTTLSAVYPALTGLTPVQKFEKGSLIVDYPAPNTGGYFDIFVFNAAGYTNMKETVYIPGASTQFPYVSGIEVVGVYNYRWEDAVITWDAATFEWRVA